MPKITYVEKNFRAKTLGLIEQARAIIEEYEAQGLTLTLRQVYYQHVARGLLPNSEKSYKLMGDVISDARLAGLIDWNSIVDRTRHVRQLSHWESPQEIVRACAKQYREEKWADQPNYCEVWIEKDALVGVIEPTCQELDVACLSCRGYLSQSEAWQSAMRLKDAMGDGKLATVLHLGDHDPSGIDMSRDIQDRLNLFCGTGDGTVAVERIALTMKQVRKYNPPPNPAKLTDSRVGGYIAEHGNKSWELDALEPKVLVALVRKHVLGLRDDDIWQASVEKEKAGREKLHAAAGKMEEEKE
jgi:hypothetical protein